MHRGVCGGFVGVARIRKEIGVAEEDGEERVDIFGRPMSSLASTMKRAFVTHSTYRVSHLHYFTHISILWKGLTACGEVAI
jgi:hypothetical protein